jgi:dephospho-CoA kinase
MITLICTGGIGSGKSYVIRIFKALGVPCYIADDRAKQLYATDKKLLDGLIELLGNEILIDGAIDRKAMASKIFSDTGLLAKVNSIVHPRVLEDFIEWRELQRSNGEWLVLFESAIFIESPVFHGIEDKILVVKAPEHIRLERVIKRDGISEDQVRERMSRQLTDSEKIKKADYIVHTDGKRAVLPQIMDLLKNLKELNNI